MSNSKLTMPVPRERYQRVDALTGRPTLLQDPCVRVWGWIGGLVDGGLVGWVGVRLGTAGKPFPTGFVDGAVAAGTALPLAGEVEREAAPPGSACAAYAPNAPTSPTAVTAVHRVTRETRRRPASRRCGAGAPTKSLPLHADLTVTPNVRRWR